MTTRTKASQAEAAAAVEAMSRFVNNFAMDSAMFVEGLSLEHRTLQQSATGVMLQWLRRLASLTEYEYDLRNEAAVQAAKICIEALDKDGRFAAGRLPSI